MNPQYKDFLIKLVFATIAIYSFFLIADYNFVTQHEQAHYQANLYHGINSTPQVYFAQGSFSGVTTTEQNLTAKQKEVYEIHSYIDAFGYQLSAAITSIYFLAYIITFLTLLFNIKVKPHE